MRDILQEEVRAAIAATPSRHRRRRDGRSEVTQRIEGRTLLVVYQRIPGGIRVINAMWET